jgi:hypothetical protein
MGNVTVPSLIKIITGLIFSDPEISNKITSSLSKKLGPVDFVSELFPFDRTSYYSDEMGTGLSRRFVSFKKLKKAEKVSDLKIFTNKLEKRFSCSGKRQINIDPGYLTLSKLVLLTTKNYTHRIYVKDGIYAEVTLFYKDGSYQPWKWTFPDYATKEYIHFFNKIREDYLKDVRGLNISPR